MKKISVLLALFIPLFAQAQTLALGRVESPGEVPFARPFIATVEVSHPSGQSIVLLPDSVPAEFALTQTHLQPVSSTSTQAQLTLIPFTLSRSTFTASFALSTNPDVTIPVEIPLTVTPVKLFKDNNFKEIRPPHHPFDWALWLCILLALTALTYLIIWWVRHLKNDPTRLSTSVDNRPAHVIALSQIDQLINSGLWENEQYKVFYITLTDILRNYLQRGFGLDVSADTSAELLRHLKTQPHFHAFIQSLRAFLASGDLVKFAKAIPDEKIRNTDITLLREFILQTAPKPTPEVPARVEVKL